MNLEIANKKIEIYFKFDFKLESGAKLDACIQGEEVDIKCTVRTDWMIPPEAFDEICLLIRIDEQKGKFWVGVVRASLARLRPGRNRDGKTSLSATGKEDIIWLLDGGDMPHSFLDTIDPELKERLRCLRSGQARIDEFLRHVQGRIIPRDALVTVANQKDPMKRVRDARKVLSTEGLLVLGHQGKDPEVAKRRGFPPPKKGEILVIPAEEV